MKKLFIFILLAIPALTLSTSCGLYNMLTRDSLGYAAVRGNIEYIKNYKGDINKHYGPEDYTALIEAADSSDKTEGIKALIDNGADINAVDKNVWTALMHAADKGYINPVLVLIKAGAEINTIDHEGQTALILAVKNGDLAITLALINAKADVNIKDYTGSTALTYAVIGKNPGIQNLLMNAQQIQDENKNTSDNSTLHNDTKMVNKPNLSVDVDTKIPKGYSDQNNAIAVVVGNRDYRNGIPAVDYALQDARVMKLYFETTFRIPAEHIVIKENITLADTFGLFGTENEPSSATIYRTVQLYKPTRVYIYYSGHGIPGLKDHKGYIAPVDMNKDYVEQTAYPLRLLYANIARLKDIGVKHAVVILESCFSGESGGGRLVENISPVNMVVDNPLISENIGSIYAATSGSDYSVWYPQMGHGLFTYYFLKGLSGYADKRGDKNITLAEMREYLDKTVPERANIIRAFEQTPQIIGDENEVLVRLR